MRNWFDRSALSSLSLQGVAMRSPLAETDAGRIAPQQYRGAVGIRNVFRAQPRWAAVCPDFWTGGIFPPARLVSHRKEAGGGVALCVGRGAEGREKRHVRVTCADAVMAIYSRNSRPKHMLTYGIVPPWHCTHFCCSTLLAIMHLASTSLKLALVVLDLVHSAPFCDVEPRRYLIEY